MPLLFVSDLSFLVPMGTASSPSPLGALYCPILLPSCSHSHMLSFCIALLDAPIGPHPGSASILCST